MSSVVEALDRVVDYASRVIVTFSLIGILVFISLAVVARRLDYPPPRGWDEIVECFFAWVVFTGAFAHWRAGTLFKVVVLDNLLRGGWKNGLRIVVALLMLCQAVVMLVWGWEFAFETGEETLVLLAPKTYWYAALPVAGLGATVYGVVHLWRLIAGRDQGDVAIEEHI